LQTERLLPHFNKKKRRSVAEGKRREIEGSLGLQQVDEAPNMDESYLAKIDVVKQLFHYGPFRGHVARD